MHSLSEALNEPRASKLCMYVEDLIQLQKTVSIFEIQFLIHLFAKTHKTNCLTLKNKTPCPEFTI
jgi:hypothetical protein